VPRIVQHTPRGRAWKLEPLTPEAKARAVEFFAKMGVKRPDEPCSRAMPWGVSEMKSPCVQNPGFWLK
jgi:hypothetical protein